MLRTLPEIVLDLWGRKRGVQVTQEYWNAAQMPLLMRDLAIFCNAAAHVQGATEFDRGVEEGKRRVWLHVSRMAGLKPSDFVGIADGLDQ